MENKSQKNSEDFSNSTNPIANNANWKNFRIGITGANGSLGLALIKRFRAKGAFVVGITHRPIQNPDTSEIAPNEWVLWQCGEESLLMKKLEKLDILVLNHGFNPKGLQNCQALNDAIEINALSTWRLVQNFQTFANKNRSPQRPREVWVNTSEAEIQPALSPGYEVSKRLIGQLVSYMWNNLDQSQRKKFRIRKLILGPFFSKLNPFGIMSAEFVANQVIRQAELGLNLIIVTPNPITYLFIPINEILRSIYCFVTRQFHSNT